MEIFGFIMSTMLSLVAFGIAVFGLLYVLAKTNRHACHVETGGMKFVVKGETIISVLDNIPGFYVDQTTYDLKTDGEPGNRREPGWLQNAFGIYWVSIFYPMIKIHDFKVVADKLKEEVTGQGLPLRERIQTEIRNAEGYLRYRFTHPVLVPNIELGKDRWKVDLMIVVDIRILNGKTVAFDYKGTVMRQVDAAISSAALDYWNNIEDDDGNRIEFGYPEFVASDKGPTSGFAGVIMELNNSTSPALTDDGLKTRFGVEIMAAWVEEADLSPEQKTLDNAARGVEEKRLLAEGRKQEAEGERAYEEATRKGVGQGLASIVQSLVDSGVSKEQAAIMAQEQIRTANLAGPNSKLTTYIEGGSGVKPNVSI